MKIHWNVRSAIVWFRMIFDFFEGVLDPSKECLRKLSLIVKLQSYSITVNQSDDCDAVFHSDEVGVLQVGMSLRLSSKPCNAQNKPDFSLAYAGVSSKDSSCPFHELRAQRQNKQIHNFRNHSPRRTLSPPSPGLPRRYCSAGRRVQSSGLGKCRFEESRSLRARGNRTCQPPTSPPRDE